MFALTAILLSPAVAASPTAPVPQAAASAPLEHRAQQVPDLINGKVQPADFLFQGWEKKIPPEQWERIRGVMVERLGPALKVLETEWTSPTQARVTILFEKGRMPFLLEIENQAPYRATSFKMDR